MAEDVVVPGWVVVTAAGAMAEAVRVVGTVAVRVGVEGWRWRGWRW